MMEKLIALIAVFGLFAATTNAIRCLECSGVATEKECAKKGKVRECRLNEDACEIELRQHEGFGYEYKIYKHCKDSKACDDNYVQNPRDAWLPTQCNSDSFNSVCRCCCYEDECNVAIENCKGNHGCARPPANIPHGRISCTSGRDYGSTCTVTCNSDTRMSGAATINCKHDGSWSGPVAKCLDIRCPPRTELEFGWFICTKSDISGSICIARCSSGYTLVGTSRSTCTSIGRWNAAPPKCLPIQCPALSPIESGTVICSDERNTQSRCNVVCDEFSTRIGVSDFHCQNNGRWSHPQPTCASIQCPRRNNLRNGRVTCTLGIDVTSVCQARCNAGYDLYGSAESTCLPTGAWNKPLPICVRIRCPKREVVDSGTVSCTDSVFVGSVCAVICKKGTRLIGVSTSECLATGIWSVPLPTCERIECPNRGSVTNGVVSCTDEKFLGSVCTTKCDFGTKLVGSPESTCLITGEWSKPLPTCPRITCPDLDFSREPGSMVCTDDFYHASTCSFTCDSGFGLIDAQSVRCQITGLWTSTTPQCIFITCPKRGRLSNGVVTCSDGSSVGSTCRASCNEGFKLVGSKDSTCTVTGEWNVELPICEPIVCPKRDVVEGRNVTCTNGDYYKSVCTTRCTPGFVRVGPIMSECMITGEWDVLLPTCVSRPCPDQGVLNHGSITCTNKWNRRSVCSFSCETPYELYPKGRTKNTCRVSQKWNVAKPCCTRPCPPYAVMDIVLVLDSSSSIGSDNWEKLTGFVRGIIRGFNVAPDGANFAIFRYNRVVDTDSEIFLNSYPGNIEGLLKAFGRIPYDGSGTYTGKGLRHALEVSLSAARGNRPDVKDLIFVITDGRAADDVKRPADELRRAGAAVLVLGIEPSLGALDESQLRDIAGGEENLVIAEGGFDGLDAAFATKLSSTICGDPCE